MSVVSVVITIVVVGVLLWALNQYIPMDSKIRGILNAVVVILLIIWLLQVFGVVGPILGMRLG